jgi:hypothetical protein
MAEVAPGIVLLAGAGLLLHSFANWKRKLETGNWNY